MNKTIISRISSQVSHALGVAILLILAAPTYAQETNKLYLGDVTAEMGQQFYVPVYLENTSNDITAVQFDIDLPNSNIYFNNFSSSNITLNSERIDGHTVTAYYRGTKARIVLSSSSNKTLKGNEGELLRFPVRMYESFTEGQAINISLSNVFLPNTAGENVLTEYAGASVIVDGNPDFEVSNVSLIGVDSITPGDTLTCQYTVRNVGSKATRAGFNANFYLSGSNGSGYSGPYVTHNDLLEPGDSITYTDRFAISSTMYVSSAMVWPRIQVNGSSGCGELSNASDNNSSANTADIHVLKTIYVLSPTEATWNESSGGSKYLYLYRYGNTSQTYEYFNVKIEKGDARVKLNTSSVYFRYSSSTSLYSTPYLTITNDEEVNEDDEIVVSFTKSNNTNIVVYGRYTLVDDEADGKTIKLTASQTVVTEGETFQLTAKLPDVAPNDVTLNVSCQYYSSYFQFPATVTVPTGEQSVTFDVTAIDDEIVRSSVSATFSVTATNYVKGSRTVTWQDNDNNIFSNIVDEEWELLKAIYQKANGANWTNYRWTIKDTKEATGSLSGVSVVNGHVIELSLPNRGMNCELIPEFFMFPKLQVLNLYNNQLTGEVQTVFAQVTDTLSQLGTLSLHQNQLSGNIGACNLPALMPALKTFYIYYNKIRDIYPALQTTITNLDFKYQTIDESIGTYEELLQMTDVEFAEKLPTVLTYNHANQKYNIAGYYDLNGTGWGMALYRANNGSAFSRYTLSGSSPWNRQPSGEVMTFTSRSTSNSINMTFEFEQGNANFDTKVNLSDLQTMITFALQPESNTSKLFNFYAANLIADDVINVQDVVAEINLMFDKGFTPNFAPRRFAPDGTVEVIETTNCLYVENGQLVLKSDTPVAALDIVLESNEVQWTEALSWFTQKQRGGRTIFYSLFGDEIPAGETILATYSGDIFDAMIVDLEGNEIPLGIGLNEVNGIHQVEEEPLTNDNVYDLSGREIVNRKSVNRKLPKGLYIVNGKKQVIK